MPRPNVRTTPVTAIIPIRDQLDHTKRVHECLAAQTVQPHITYLNDGSGAETLDWLDQFAGGSLVHVEDTEGLTIYEAWNLGFWLARRASGDGGFHVLVANNDIVLPHYAVEVMSQALLAEPERIASYPDWEAPWRDEPIDALRGANPAVQETRGVWGSNGMTGFCFMLAGHRVSWRPLIQDLAYRWWYGDNHLARTIELAGGKQVKCLGLPIIHAHEGTAHAYDLAQEKEDDRKHWEVVMRSTLASHPPQRGHRVVQCGARRDWRQRPPTRPGPDAA